jgi:hypothetical protein
MSTYVPISLEEHKNKRWLRHNGLAFTKNQVVAPIFVNELASAAHAMTIAFVKNDQDFSLVAVLGLRSGENLLLAPNGSWLSTYIPLTYRVRPFQLLPLTNDPNQQVLCVEESHITDSSEGEPFFDDSGSLAPFVSELFEISKHFNSSRQLTQSICTILSKYNLIRPWDITLQDGDEQHTVAGLYQINEAALNMLENEAFLEIRHAGALPVIYAQLYAKNNLSILGQLMQQTQSKKPVDPVIASETFNFSGLS